MSKILVTGAAGFVGYHMVKKLLAQGYELVGLDNLNSYYSVNLKYDRLKELGIIYKPDQNIYISQSFDFYHGSLENKELIFSIFEKYKFEYVIHLAAQAGVRYSLENPQTYIDSNITGSLNILEACRTYKPKHLVFASSSSVYGLNTVYPFNENHSTDHPISLYAATKKANEMMAHTYAHLFQLPVTGLRFFTVYGSWGRPDMAPILFAKNILNRKPIQVFNNGEMYRDFTHVSDITESILRLLPVSPKINTSQNTDSLPSSESSAPYKIFNIGNNNPIKLIDFITELENALGVEAIKEYKEIQPGDVVKTFADSSSLYKAIDFKPSTSLKDGIQEFASWFKTYHGSI